MAKKNIEVSGHNIIPYLASITKYMESKGLELTPLPKVTISKSTEYANDVFGKTAFYNPQENTITLFVAVYPRAFVSLTPSSNEIAPANANAEYSPNDRPMATVQLSMAAGSSIFSFSSAAMLETKIAVCATSVLSSSSFGPLTHLASKS